MNERISIAIETSCRAGGIALARGETLLSVIPFDAAARHATQLIPHLGRALDEAALRPGDIEEVYVSAGPGSFTGLRIGITVARTLGQMLPDVRCVRVPTAHAIALNAEPLRPENLGVILDAKRGVYASLFVCREGQIVPAGPATVVAADEFLARAPRPLLLIGEGLQYHDLHGEGVELGGAELSVPRAENVWRVGRMLARSEQFTDVAHLLPIYSRQPEAVTLWDSRYGKGS